MKTPSTTTEWTHGTPRMAWARIDAPIEVWLDDGSVRRAQRGRFSYPDYELTDCSHPAQNMFLMNDRIQAWRLTNPEKSI